MNQSIVVKDETLNKIVSQAEKTLGRELTDFEKTLMEYAVDQIRLGLV